MTSTGQKVLLGASAIAAAGLAASYLLSRPSSVTPEIQKYEPASKRIIPEEVQEGQPKRMTSSPKPSGKSNRKSAKPARGGQSSSSQQSRHSNEFSEALFVRQSKVFNQLHPLVKRLERSSPSPTSSVNSKKVNSQGARKSQKNNKARNQKPSRGTQSLPEDEVFGPTYAHAFSAHATDNTDGIVSDLRGNMSANVKRLQKLSDDFGITSSRFVRTPLDYYDWTLEQRRDLLKAPSTSYLCKSLLVSNTKCIHDDCSRSENSKYYLIVYQYVERFNSEKVMNFVRRLNKFEIGKRKFNFQLAPEAVSDEISGFKHNAVTPLGMRQTDVPIILSHKVLELGFVWLGGGEPDVKWGVNVSDFRNHFRPYVADVTD